MTKGPRLYKIIQDYNIVGIGIAASIGITMVVGIAGITESNSVIHYQGICQVSEVPINIDHLAMQCGNTKLITRYPSIIERYRAKRNKETNIADLNCTIEYPEYNLSGKKYNLPCE